MSDIWGLFIFLALCNVCHRIYWLTVAIYIANGIEYKEDAKKKYSNWSVF